MKTKIALILMALACAFAAVPAYAEYTPEQIREWRAAANRGEAWAQCNLGNSYYNGEGVEKDSRESVRWYRKSAEQGNADAQYLLGVCYYNGLGVKANRDEARRLFSLAAAQGLSAGPFVFLAPRASSCALCRGMLTLSFAAECAETMHGCHAAC